MAVGFKSTPGYDLGLGVDYKTGKYIGLCNNTVICRNHVTRYQKSHITWG